MKKIKKILVLILLVLVSLSLISCASTTDEGPIRISESSIELSVGESKRIRYEKLTSDTLDINFYTNNALIATVNKVGYVTGRSSGETTIDISVGEYKYSVNVKVNRTTEFKAPDKIVYQVGEELDLTGCTITLYNTNGTVKEIVQVTKSMVTGFDSSEAGTLKLTVKYGSDTFTFGVSIVEAGGAEIYEFDSPTFSDIKAGEVNTVKLTPRHKTELLKSLVSLYDYSEFEISFDFIAPSGDKDTVYAFYNQDYSETHKTLTSMNTSQNIEGQVISKAGYNYETVLTESGEGYFAVRYNPDETGSYTYKMYIKAAGEIIETKEGSFNVSGTPNSKGTIGVASNGLGFVFEDGSSYIPVGANIAWYNSKQRRYNDYTLYLEGMKKGGYNFMRYWMAAWGAALWWEDITDYSNRLDEAYEQDKILEMMGENGIYVSITLYHHGMFSKQTNPMWKGSSETWYTNKYGYNPYSDKLSSPGQFFSDENAIKWTKNYIKYVVARYTSYDSIMSYELFNEIDWIEDYNINTGKNWHETMANYIKEIDYKGRMVTTSIKDASANGSVARSLYSLDAIDYTNYHIYASLDFITSFQSLASTYLNTFNKPVMIEECGYSGESGAKQHEVDPSDTSLHEQLWAGMMTMAVTAMPWWWETWIEKYNSYDVYKGVSKYASYMNINGSYTTIQNTSRVSLDTSNVRKMGFDFSDRFYIYLSSKSFRVGSTNNNVSLNMTITLSNASYNVKVFNTVTGEFSESNITVTNGSYTIPLSFTNDVALIITKN